MNNKVNNIDDGMDDDILISLVFFFKERQATRPRFPSFFTRIKIKSLEEASQSCLWVCSKNLTRIRKI